MQAKKWDHFILPIQAGDITTSLITQQTLESWSFLKVLTNVFATRRYDKGRAGEGRGGEGRAGHGRGGKGRREAPS